MRLKVQKLKNLLRYGSYVATITGAIFAVFLLYSALQGITDSKNLLDETQKATKNLSELVDKTNQQLQTLNKTVTQISHQTTTQAYLEGRPFEVEIISCWYNEQNKTISYYPQILDKQRTLAALQFKLVTSFSYYTTSTLLGNIQYSELVPLLGKDDVLIEPGRQQSFQHSFSRVLDDTRNSPDSFLYVRSQYEFAPYSNAIDSIITDYVKDEDGDLIIGFKRNESTGEWELLTTNQNTICK